MATSWKSAREVLLPGALLSTAGVMITAILVGVAAHFLLGLTLMQGLLLGSVVSCTDAASVFSILRSNNMNLKAPLAPLLELESSSNDPAAYMLTITIISLMKSDGGGFFGYALMFVMQLAVGAGLGFAFGFAGALLINRIRLNSDGLYPVVAATIASFVFAAVQLMRGNGLLGVYIAAMVMGNVKLVHKTSLVRFFDGFSWLMQILVFVTLGLLVFPSQLRAVWLPALVMSAALMFLIRPAAVFITLSGFKYPLKAKLFVSWVGLRGASSIVFATYALTEGIQNADTIFNMVFFISLTSVIIQGSMLTPVASMLGQLDKEDKTLVSRSFTDYEEDIQGTLYELRAVRGSKAVGEHYSADGKDADQRGGHAYGHNREDRSAARAEGAPRAGLGRRSENLPRRVFRRVRKRFILFMASKFYFPCHFPQSTSLPGFKMFCGSKASFTLFMSSICASSRKNFI